ncbi:MAG: hypothetical protein WAT78_09835 [Rhizobiaceae bacterium]
MTGGSILRICARQPPKFAVSNEGYVMRQIAFSQTDRNNWGSIVDTYNGAFGTGSKYTDPNATDVGLNEDIWMMHKVTINEIRSAWVGSGMNTTEKESAWHSIHLYKDFFIYFIGYKIKRGIFSSVIIAGSISMMLDRDQVNIGWLVGSDFHRLFSNYDLWLSGGIIPFENIEIAINSN